MYLASITSYNMYFWFNAEMQFRIQCRTITPVKKLYFFNDLIVINYISGQVTFSITSFSIMYVQCTIHINIYLKI